MGNWVYSTTTFVIRLVKSIELFFIRLFPTMIERWAFEVCKKAGVTINGNKPWDIRVKDKETYIRAANEGSLGLGESYMDGHWDTEDLVELTSRLMKHGVYDIYMDRVPWNRLFNYLELNYFNLQTRERAWEVGQKHYDLGNDLFESFLDPAMNYSCGYWRNANNLTEAQYAKMELAAKKLNLKPGMRVLDIGCGWGALAYHLAKNYGVSVVGITISKEQVILCEKRCAGLKVDVKLMDYRDVDEKFDRIVSIGMFEHVGPNNYPEFFKTVHKCLKDDGIFLLHTMGVNHYNMPAIEPWIHRYIFANMVFPYHKDITKYTDKLFVIEDWQNFGNDYSKTLLAWLENFKNNWPTIQAKYGPRFYRMWTYYLQFTAGAFHSRKLQVWQVVLSKDGIQGGYYAAR